MTSGSKVYSGASWIPCCKNASACSECKMQIFPLESVEPQAKQNKKKESKITTKSFSQILISLWYTWGSQICCCVFAAIPEHDKHSQNTWNKLSPLISFPACALYLLCCTIISELQIRSNSFKKRKLSKTSVCISQVCVDILFAERRWSCTPHTSTLTLSQSGHLAVKWAESRATEAGNREQPRLFLWFPLLHVAQWCSAACLFVCLCVGLCTTWVLIPAYMGMWAVLSTLYSKWIYSNSQLDVLNSPVLEDWLVCRASVDTSYFHY